MLKQAAILVGGLGSRLKERTHDTPKPLLNVGGRPFLEYILDEVSRHGFSDIVLLAGHLGQQVENLYNGRTWRESRIRVIREPQPLGTGGALSFAASQLDERFVLMNGDTFFDINLRALVKPSLFPPSGLVMALRSDALGKRFGRVSLSEGLVKSFHASDETCDGPINGGIYCMSSDIAARIPKEKISLENDVFPDLARKGLIHGTVFDGYFIDIGVPDDLVLGDYELPRRTCRPAVFFDRDGVLNTDTGYVSKADNFEWIEGAKAAIRLCNDAGFLVFVVTNQAGVAHGYYCESDVLALHEWICEDLETTGAHVDAFEFCPHHPDGNEHSYRRDCRRRKPESGMIDDLLATWNVDVSHSFLIGDKEIDIAAATKAGIRGHFFRGGNLEEFVKQRVAEIGL